MPKWFRDLLDARNNGCAAHIAGGLFSLLTFNGVAVYHSVATGGQWDPAGMAAGSVAIVGAIAGATGYVNRRPDARDQSAAGAGSPADANAPPS